MKIELTDLIDLYAYRLSDMAAGRDPRGGRYSVHRLRRQLLVEGLSGGLARRFMEADRVYRRLDWREGDKEAAVTEASTQKGDSGSVRRSRVLQPETLELGLIEVLDDDISSEVSSHPVREEGFA